MVHAHPPLSLPPIGFGTSLAYDDESTRSVLDALQTGYRLIDTADIYRNEEAVGEAIRQSGLDRGDILITSKLHINKKGYESTREAFEVSLQKLGLDYMDLYLIHWPANAKHNPNDWQHINSETWRAMEDILDSGRVRGIGLSNFMPEHLDALMQTARVTPLINQIELHPGHAQVPTRTACDRYGIQVEAWSPLGIGALMDHPLLVELAARYHRSVAQICLRWCVQLGAIPIPKSVNPARIAENFQVLDFYIEQEDMERINAMPSTAYTGWDPYTMSLD